MRSLVTAALLLLVINSTPQADTFEDAGLGPTACRLVEYDKSSVREAVDLLKSMGARSLQVFPHGVIFGMMSGEVGNGLSLGLAASFYRSTEEFRAGCPDLDQVVLSSVGNLLQGDEYRRCLLDAAGESTAMRIESGSLPHPDQDDILDSMTRRKTPRSPAGGRKWPTQNSEFLIGSVLINVVFPQGSSLVETWTEDEFAQVISSISIGLSELQQYTHWIDLVFYFNYSDFKWVPVDVEPSRTHWYDHEDWLTEALTSLGYPGLDSYIGTFELNNDTRAEFGTDWVFTAYIADMSDNWDAEMTYYDPRCWGGWSDEHESRSPVSYAYLGGPFLVVSHPACWLDYGVGFYRVFMHEMFHIFWAYDEYCGESCCNVRTGYFNTINWNVCGPAELCVMQGVRYGPQLCLCNYTMMQMGLTDINENSIPDVFDVPPVIEFIEGPGFVSDTIFTDDYILSARGFNDVVENVNPFQIERYPDDMIDYGAVLKKGHYRINGGFAVDIFPSDGKWDESIEDLGMFISGFDPGQNILELELENFVGCRVSAQKEVYLVGLKYYSFSIDSRDDDIVLEWMTGAEVFGAGFEISRRDLDTGCEYAAVDTVTVPDEIGYNRRAWSYRDACVIPGHTYRYRLVGRFDFQDGEETRSFEVLSGELDYRAPFPTFDGQISRICPNPSSGCVSFTVDVPPSYHEVGGERRSPAVGSVTELKTKVEVMVYDVSGRAVRSLFDLPVFGGQLTLTWDGTDRNGLPVSTGVYFIRVKAGPEVSTRKTVILR